MKHLKWILSLVMGVLSVTLEHASSLKSQKENILSFIVKHSNNKPLMSLILSTKNDPTSDSAKFLEDPENFKVISQLAFEMLAYPKRNDPLTHEEKFKLLALCIEREAIVKNLKLYTSETETIIGGFDDWIVTESYFHKTDPHHAIFWWNTGNGAHNAQFCPWLITFTDGIFSATPLEIQKFNVRDSKIENYKTTLAQAIEYSPSTQITTIRTSGTHTHGDMCIWQGNTYHYRLYNDKLELILQKHTRNYKVFANESAYAVSNWVIDYSKAHKK